VRPVIYVHFDLDAGIAQDGWEYTTRYLL